MNEKEAIFTSLTESQFTDLAFKAFEFQKKNNPIYSAYVNLLKRDSPKRIEEIPFLPISFFKKHQVLCEGLRAELIFRSSGTGGERSSHSIPDSTHYLRSCYQTYVEQIGNPENQVILALLPNYLEQGESSLVYMVDHLIKRSANSLSSFILNDNKALLKAYQQGTKEGKKIILFGVSYALLDLAEEGFDLSLATIIETGGMKGRRQELQKDELHHLLKAKLNGPEIKSEYGMTELQSQAYCGEDLIFHTAKWMKVIIRETNDPFSICQPGKTGGINIIDLANWDTCPFIASDDLGRINGQGFELMGRFDQAEVRGCNLLVP